LKIRTAPKNIAPASTEWSLNQAVQGFLLMNVILEEFKGDLRFIRGNKYGQIHSQFCRTGEIGLVFDSKFCSLAPRLGTAL